MALTTADWTQLEALKTLLREHGRHKDFEKLVAALIGRLLNVPIFVARSGFQHGADAGPAGASGRRFRIECKKYGDSTDLSERELLGEIDQALARDPALEGWFLAATKSVDETLAQSLEQHGDKQGVPVVIIDWSGPGFPPLAALCAAYPDLVEVLFSKVAADAVRGIVAPHTDVLAQLKRTCQAWCLGFPALQAAVHENIRAIWNNRAISQANLNQDVAGGVVAKKIARAAVNMALTQWWQNSRKDTPAVMVGFDGVGKTWATLDWVVTNLSSLPITLILPSSAMASVGTPCISSVLSVLGARMTEITGVRDVAHWERRTRKLLERPAEEGAGLTLIFDGMNQEASLMWNQILKIMQAPPFAGRVRVIASTRTHHYGDKLASLKGLVVAPQKILVEPYSIEAGGELDQMLAFEGLNRTNLSNDLLELARTPRLFKLVVRLRERLADVKEITVHRLLWEYGRDSFGERVAHRSWSETEWREWLQEIARRVRDGITRFSRKELAEITDRADLTKNEVQARLSDILDSQFSQSTGTGQIALTPAIIAHALGLALIAELEQYGDQGFGKMEAELNGWLDTIAGMDQRAEVLRAAVSIEIERNQVDTHPVLGPLITAWLQTQNVPDEHRKELLGLAEAVVSGLLDTIQYSTSSTQSSARHWATRAIQALPKEAGRALDEIVVRGAVWLSVVTMEMYSHMMEDASYRERRQARYKERVGTSVPGPVPVLGVTINLSELGDDTLANLVPILLDGFPLSSAMRCFEAAAINLAIRGHFDVWRGLKWLCELNEIDPDETNAALRNLSDDFQGRTPEPHVLGTLGSRAAGITLCLSGIEADEKRCSELTPVADGTFDYQRDYLDSPGHSFYAMERRHADQVLGDSTLNIRTRIQKCRLMLYDPTFIPPDAFIADLRADGAQFPIDQTRRHHSYTMEDHLFEELEPALARWAPDVLASVIARFFAGIATAPPASRYWVAGHVEEYFLLADGAASTACATLRASARDNDASNENFVQNELLVIELKGQATLEQFRRIIAADITWISMTIGEVLGEPTSAEIDQLIDEYRGGTDRQKHDLMLLLSFHPQNLTEKGWVWFLERLKVAEQASDAKLRGIIVRFLTLADETRIGRILLDQPWSWVPGDDLWANHFGSIALTAASQSLPFDQLAPRVVPWLLLEAVRKRGSDEAETRLAAGILGTIIEKPSVAEPDPGSNLVFHRDEKVPTPFLIDIELRPSTKQTDTTANQLRQILDQDSRIEAWNRVINVAHSRIEEARAKGASLYLTDLDAEDFRAVVQFAKERVNRWLAGMEERTAEFKKRVRLSEGAFLALCEAMLEHEPKRGVELWRALRFCMTTRYMGDANVPDLIHMIFRVSDSAEILKAREELFGEASTDKELFELSLAARFNGRRAAIDALQAADTQSLFVWRQRRNQILEGFTGIPPHFHDSIWPADMISTTSEEIKRDAGYQRFRESAAFYWFEQFLDCKDAVQAYAAWILFRNVTDRRAWIWMREEIEKRDQTMPLYREKVAQVYTNRNSLKRKMEKHEEKSEKKFLDQDIYPGIKPWREVEDPAH